jgi:hypothetical protein
LSFVSYEDGLAEAAPGWIGSLQQALGELAARWETRHGHHKRQEVGWDRTWLTRWSVMSPTRTSRPRRSGR